LLLQGVERVSQLKGKVGTELEQQGNTVGRREKTPTGGLGGCCWRRFRRAGIAVAAEVVQGKVRTQRRINKNTHTHTERERETERQSETERERERT
jgi:hypothetical protein